MTTGEVIEVVGVLLMLGVLVIVGARLVDMLSRRVRRLAVG